MHGAEKVRWNINRRNVPAIIRGWITKSVVYACSEDFLCMEASLKFSNMHFCCVFSVSEMISDFVRRKIGTKRVRKVETIEKTIL